MSKPLPPSPKLLTSTEEVQVVRILESCLLVPEFEHNMGKDAIWYTEESIRQNRTKELLSHQDEDWVTGYSFRHGATTVMGTMREFMVAAYAYSQGYDVAVIHDEYEQVTRGRDLILSTDTRRYTVSVKPRTGKTIHETRLGSEFFTRTYDPDWIALGDFYNVSVSGFLYSELKVFFDGNRTSHRTHPNDLCDRYWYPPTSTLPPPIFSGSLIQTS